MKTSKFALFFVLLSSVFFLFAGEYGRITGKVVDKETGEPLIGAEVIVEGIDLCVKTDERGEYNISFIRSGTYNIIATFLSYGPIRYTHVVVIADRTTTINFSTRPVILGVYAKLERAPRKPLIDFSQTSSSQTIISDEIERLPVTTIDEIIKLQPEIIESDFGLHLRGGGYDEISYYLDGITIMSPYYTGWQHARINPSAVEEISIISSGYDAEYENALSGIVNIITKQGETKTKGHFHYLTDGLFSGDKLNFGYNFYDFSLGGPIPKVSQVRYFFSGDFMLTDAFQKALYKIPSPRDDFHLQGKISFLFPENRGNISVFGFKSREQWVRWSPYTESGNNLKYFDNRPMTRTKQWIGIVSADYVLTPRTLASVKIGMTHSDICYGNRDYEWEQDNNRKWYDDYRFKAEHLINYLVEGELPVRNVLIDSVMQYHKEYTKRDVEALRHSPYGIEGIFYTYGDYPKWTYECNNELQVRFQTTQDIGKHNKMKAGADYSHYELEYFNNDLPWWSNPHWDYYQGTPYKFAGYIQDKICFKRLTVRLGIRYDYFNPQTITFAEPIDFINDSIIKADAITNFSPRLGFSLLATDRLRFCFNYGHYFQVPTFHYLYTVTDTAVVRHNLVIGGATIGNILLKPQNTVVYEMGFESQLTEDIIFGFTAYFKNVHDLPAIREVMASPMPYFQYFNVNERNVYGFEFNMQKRITNIWGVGITYILQQAEGTPTYSYPDPYATVTLAPLDFDQKHTINITLDSKFPNNYAITPLQDFTSVFIISSSSGHPYTPEDLVGNQLGDVNSMRMSGFWNIDWKFNRRIRIGSAKLVLSGLINNLLDTKQIIDVYNTTGSPDDHGYPDPSLSQFGSISISSSRYSPQADHDHNGLITPVEMRDEYIAARDDLYEDPTNWKNPFRFRIGIGIEF